MLKRRLHFKEDSGGGVQMPPPPPPTLPPESVASRIVEAIIETPTPEPAAAVEPAAPGVGGSAGSSFAMARENLNATVEKTRPPIVDSAITGGGSASAAPVESEKLTLAELGAPPVQTLQFAQVTPDNSAFTEVYGTDGALTGYKLNGEAANYFVFENGDYRLKSDLTTQPTDATILALSNSIQGEDIKNWPPGRQLLYTEAMAKNGSKAQQLAWVLKQKKAVMTAKASYGYGDNRSVPTYLRTPAGAFSNRLPQGSTKPATRSAAVKEFGSMAESGGMSDDALWNAAYNAKNLEPKDVLKALKSNGKSGTDDATIAESLAGSEADDLDLGADPSVATGPTVENHKSVTAQAELILDAAAEPVLKNIDELTVDVSGDVGSIQRELTAVKADLGLTAENLKNKEPYKTRMGTAIAAGTGDAEFKKIMGELEQKRDGLQARLEQSIAASRQYEITGEIETHNQTLTEQKEALAETKKEAGLLPFLRDDDEKSQVGAALKKVSDTEKEIKKLEEEDEKLEETGNYHERYDAAVGGLAKFLTLQDELTQAARSANTEKMTELFKENGLDYPVIPTTAGLQKRAAAIGAQTAVTTAQNAQAEAQRTTRNARWEQTKKDLGTLNDGLTVGTTLLATGSGAITSISTAKTAIDTLLGNDGEMGESFTAVQGDILADATKLKSSEDVLASLTGLQDATGVDAEDPYGEGGSPAQRLAKLLDQPRSERFGNALGLNEQGEDVVSFGRSQTDIVAQNTEIASHTYEEKDNRYYVNEVQGGMKA